MQVSAILHEDGAVETIPGLLVTELRGQDSRVARLMVQCAEQRARADRLADLLHEQQRLTSAQDARIRQMQRQIDMLTGRIDPPMPPAWDGFVFQTQAGDAIVPCLAQIEASDYYQPRKHYTPVYPTVCRAWVNGAWVDITTLADAMTGCDLDDQAEAECKRRWENARGA